MADLNTITLPDLVANKEIIWQKELDSLQNLVRNTGLYAVDSWEAGTGDVREYSEIDGEEYADQKDESDDAEATTVQQGYSKTVSPFRMGNDINISWELRRRGKYSEITRRLTNISRMVAQRMDLDLSHRITFITATTYTTKNGETRDITTGDGLALASTAHLLKGTSSTYRNRLANNPQLSRGALENMEKMKVENTLNQFGTKMTMDFDILWTTDNPNTINTAREILNSTASPAAPNSGVVNVNMGKYHLVVLPRVPTTAAGAVDTTKAKYWGIAASRNQDGYLSVEEEPNVQNPTSGSNADEFSTDDWFFKARGSYAICWTGGRSIGFSDGLGTA